MKLFLCLAGAAFLTCATAQSTVLFYLSEEGQLTGYQNETIQDPAAALAALASPPSHTTAGRTLSSAIPQGTQVKNLVTDGQTATVEFSDTIIGDGLDDARLETIYQQVRATLHQYGIEDSIRLQAGGRLLSEYLPPAPVVEPRPKMATAAPAPAEAATAGALSGKSITLSPGHGKVWGGSSYSFERPVYCAPLNCEDDHNLENMQFLNQYLTQDGAVTKLCRSLSKTNGTHSGSGEPWWRVSASYWLKQIGYPCSVYASYTGDCNLGAGSSESNDSLRARPLASDYDATDIYVSLHSNGYTGDCTGSSCPNGTCTYYDASTEHATWGTISKTLATKVNAAIIGAIRTSYTDATWRDRGSLDSTGNYGEIRIPDRAAILIELAFHDTCDRDALALRDNFFRSTTMWAAYKGICDYFGVAPTWAYYSCEVVSDTIPSIMTPGATVTAQITLRNRGVLWNDAKLFRLGAVGDSDPFSATTRVNVGGEVGPGATKTFTVALTAPTAPGSYTTDWRMVRDGVAWFGPTVSRTILVSSAGDKEPPTVPAGLVATPASSTQVNLRWNASTDNQSVASYRVYRNSALLATASTNNYSDAACVSMTSYSYRVSAVDSSGNESGLSTEAQATTLPQLDFIIDNTQGSFVGLWTNGTSSTDKYLADYQWLATATTATGSFTWTPRIEQAGYYTVQIWYPQGGNRCTNSPFTVHYSGGSVTVPVDQTSGGGAWVSLGAARPFVTGTNGYVQLRNVSQEPSKVVMADAVRFTYASALGPIGTVGIATSSGGGLPSLNWTNPAAVLQESPSGLPGTWTDVPDASSPFTIVPGTAPQKYYRLRY